MTESGTVDYKMLAAQAEALLSGQSHVVANAANLSALVYQELPAVNWAGFYFLEGGELVLGPFQGKPACVRIPMGHGVCGTAAATGEIQRVEDVRSFDGHIVCDADSRSELVVPLFSHGRLLGVLDLDSPLAGRFSEIDAEGVAALAEIYVRSVERNRPA